MADIDGSFESRTSFGARRLRKWWILLAATHIKHGWTLTFYEPVWQDWVWYAAMPCGAYAGIAGAAAVLRTHTQFALFAIAAASLGVLLIGVHNAWDTVTHIVAFDDDAM